MYDDYLIIQKASGLNCLTTYSEPDAGHGLSLSDSGRHRQSRLDKIEALLARSLSCWLIVEMLLNFEYRQGVTS